MRKSFQQTVNNTSTQRRIEAARPKETRQECNHATDQRASNELKGLEPERPSDGSILGYRGRWPEINSTVPREPDRI
jgi:hypothetical protein